MKQIFVALTVAFLFVAGNAQAATPDSSMSALLRQAPGLRAEVLRLALDATNKADNLGLIKRRNLLTVIDYSLPSSQPRLFVFDLAARKLLFRELVAHGKNSGGDQANFFSNSPGSLATSLGLFVTADTYFGNNGYSLRLKGLEEGINDMAMDRAIVMHGAAYVSREAIKALGRLGRSWGCPAVRKEVAQKIIDTVRGGSPIFAYYPEKSWLAHSSFVPREDAAAVITASR
ncbi:MAG TPA: murein L,D-transpeptidase catalytic domain family protein [Thermoanaerobaculia bacterium]|nr:murein L,D-transpeptidase catalytic domain family protein [Thermoanaerobaculia bacterium]